MRKKKAAGYNDTDSGNNDLRKRDEDLTKTGRFMHLFISDRGCICAA